MRPAFGPTVLLLGLCAPGGSAFAQDADSIRVESNQEYAPLVSKGIQFTPGGDTHFKKGEALFAILKCMSHCSLGCLPQRFRLK
jgi:hypothetical protein